MIHTHTRRNNNYTIEKKLTLETEEEKDIFIVETVFEKKKMEKKISTQKILQNERRRKNMKYICSELCY